MNKRDYRILLLEDDAELASLICRYLEQRGCEVTHTDSGASFMKALHHREYDLILSDIILPDASGFQLLEHYRNQLKCPLIFLSALSSVRDQVNGLELGACDFLVKPIDPELLWAKIEAKLRTSRNPAPATSDINFGTLQLDLAARHALVDGEPLKLTANEFDLLQIFAEQPARPLSREYLFRRVVGREFDGLDRVVDMRISRLRKKLDAIGQGVAIRSIRGRGYALHTASSEA
ncbi:response regulator transcription factor [uncultured Microbulbifer sp.]|uniref:response regulator transcription factor n=1 Tax=uncultured Microbulbifer sp. TaxID=348147 RepID=UPI0025F535E0|nr:response regulator transcription factor [uncultured Microbulbifer sp.]